MNKEARKGSIWKNCITIPNMLSVFRLILIPFFVYAYCVEQNFWKTAALLALSGISDTADGYIARRFNMVSDLGKIIDPVADKLTQAAMLLCLLTRYPLMLLPLLLLTFKEVSTGIMSLIVIRKTGLVMSADWHGKVTTGLLYAMMLTHIIWYRIPVSVCDDRCLHGNDAAVVRAVHYQERKGAESRSGLHARKRRTISFNERNKSGEIRHDLADTI